MIHPRLTSRSRFRALLCMLWLLVIVPAFCRAGNLNVTVVLSGNSAPYLSFATTLRNNLPELVHTTVLEHAEALPPATLPVDLIVAVGIKATELAIAQSDIPVLATMIPEAGYEELLAQESMQKSTRQVSAIYLDQPWERRIDFVRAALPEQRRIGVLRSQDTPLDVARLRQQVTQRGGSLVVRTVSSAEGLFSQLESVLTGSDVLLAIPDSQIYSNSNIRNILLTSYRYGIPLIGLSQAYVNAGALCAIFSTPEQLASQAGTAVRSFAQTGQLIEPQYPVTFTVAVNQQVAQSMGMELPSAEVIHKRMDKIGGGEINEAL